MQQVKPGTITILTVAKIRAIRLPETGQVEIRDKSVPGLRIRVGSAGSRSFVLRKSVAGRYRNVTLGRYCERIGLAEARKKARQFLSDIEFSADPVALLPVPVRSRVVSTVRSLWPDYRAAKCHLRKIREVERVFERHILPAFGDVRPTRSPAARSPGLSTGSPARRPSWRAMFSPTSPPSTAGPCRDSTTCPATHAAMAGARQHSNRASGC